MPTAPEKRRKVVAVLIESTRTYGRELIRGVDQYNKERGDWIVEYVPRGHDDPPPAWLKRWKGDGILARVNSRRLLDAILETGIPTVDFRRNIVTPNIPNVGPNDLEVVRMLLAHFRERGFFSFGYFGYRSYASPSFSARFAYFKQLTAQEGLLRSSLLLGDEAKPTFMNQTQLDRLHRWLLSLPPRTAIVGCNDDVAFHLLRECRASEIAVPDRIAVAGIGNDECLCSLCRPTLTSVDLNPSLVGYRGAATLDRMMNGEPIESRALLARPRQVVVRKSTDAIATDDQKLIDAVRFIRDNACAGIGPEQVVKSVHLSRMAMETRFKRVLNQTIHQVIVKYRLRRVCELLATTDMTHKQIAEETGFSYPEYLMRLFRRQTGSTLKEYRAQNRDHKSTFCDFEREYSDSP